MIQHDLMPWYERESEFPVSRDWAEISCLALSCEYNRNAQCGVPSLAKFNEEGTCINKKIKPLKQVVDGD